MSDGVFRSRNRRRPASLLPPGEGARKAPRRAPQRRPSGIAPATALALAWALTSAAQTPAAPKPKPNDLLKSAPFDRIVLTDGANFEVEPLTTRPLPPLDKKARTIAEIESTPTKTRPNRRDPFEKKDDGEGDQMVIIHLMDGEPRDFKVKRSSIKDVEYFEDMLLVEADRLIKDNEFVRAFERLQLVKSRDPNWRGLDDRVNKLLFEEGVATLLEDNARGLRFLIDLQARKPDYPGLADKLAASYALRIDRAVQAGDIRGGRRLVRELEAFAPNHLETRNARAGFVDRAKAQMAQAARSSPGERVDRLAEASRTWPELDGLESAYREAFRAEPTLTVGVDDLADRVSPFPNSPASARVARLLYVPLLALDDEAGLRGEAGEQLLASFETFELGKGLRIGLKLGPNWSDGSRPVSALDVARSLADRAVPASPAYNARWADLLDRIEATADDRLEVKLTRSAMKPESWLLEPVGPGHAGSDGWVSSLDQGRRPVGDGPYRWESSTESACLLRSAAGGRGIRRIREVRYAKPEVAYEALLRGEIALLEHVAPEKLAELAKMPDRFRVGRCSTPNIHLIALDGRSPALRNRELRRALSLATDRKGLLEDVVLRHPSDDMNLVADGPFLKESFVDASDVPPFEYNPLLAKGLVTAARREMGGNPPALTLEYPNSPEARAVCPRLAEAYKLIGVTVKLVERPESDLEAELHAGRRFDLAYRSVRVARPLRDAGPLLVPGYDAPPSADALASAASPRILQLLIQLDRAGETTTARALAMQVDRESRDELPILPLWQLEGHHAWRAELRGPLETAEHLYQNIAAWEIDPWFVKD